MPTPRGPRRSGRRPGTSGTREEILRSARELFGDNGFEGTTLRAVASSAGVDVALVAHYFGNKEGLFRHALSVPIGEVLGPVLTSDGDSETLGERIVRAYLTLWEHPETADQMRALVRCGTSRPDAASRLRESVLEGLAAHVPPGYLGPNPGLRMTLIGAQLVGLGLLRSIIEVPPLPSTSIDHLVDAVGPTVQRYVNGEITR